MNKRIKKLSEQANAWYPDGYPSAEGGDEAWQNLVIFEKEDLEKFARLIVQECIEVCNSRVGNSDYNTGRMHCVSDLKEHFGVEE